MATVDGIGLAEPSTITKSLAAALITRNSSATYQEILSIGDPDSTTALAIAKVTDSAPASTAMGLVVRVADPSTTVAVSTGSVRVIQSTAADLNVTVAGYSTITTVSTGSVRVHQSTAADLNVTVAGYSTVTTVSTGSVRVHQSTAADLNVAVSDGTGNALESSTSAPSSGARGLVTRQVIDASTTFAASTVGNDSTSATIASSNAATAAYVYAYSVMSTITGSLQAGFYSSNTLIWPMLLASSGGVMVGANLAVTPPAYLFRASTGNALSFRFPSGTNAGVNVGVSFWLST